ncbi:MAG: 23S rRNA (pseudouridine(1915)-N(3))-methyltransferase RlmH [Bacillota bacterium]|nr:23S rRNA (pseudouridine(1915)-N(3))-methyltransferase RlmH [Bacillota bacterium]
MNIKLFIRANKTEKYYEKARKEYEKRLKRYCKISVREYKNKGRLTKELQGEKCVIFVDETGEQISSEKLAEKISRAEVGGISSAAVVVGAPVPEDLSGEHLRMSVSRMSLSENLLAAVVLEQIYRAYKIINGETYHK